MRLACDIFGWNRFDEDAFQNNVDHLTAVYPDKLIFHLKDGREVRTEWQNRSRAESWTPEMKENARVAAKRLGPKNGPPEMKEKARAVATRGEL